MDALHDGIALYAEVADGGAVQVAEQAAVVVAHLVAVGDGVSLSVERAGELCVLAAYHEGGVVALAQVDVGHELGIGLRSASANQPCEDEVVLRGAEEVVAVLFVGEEVDVALGVDGKGFLGGHGAVDVAVDEEGVEVVEFVELILGEYAREGVQQVVHLFGLVHEGDVGLLALVDLQEEARELLHELVLGFGLRGGGYGFECLPELVLEGLAEVGIGRVVVGEVELVVVEDGVGAAGLRREDAVEALGGFVGLSVVEDADVAEAEPVACESCAGLADADGQCAVGDLAEHAVLVAAGLEGVAAAHDALHRIACQLSVLVGHGEVGHGTGDVAVHAVDGFLRANHVLDVRLEVVVDAVGVERCGVVDVVEVRVGRRTEGAVDLQLIDAVGQSCQGLVHVHRCGETFGSVQRAGLRRAPSGGQLAFPSVELAAEVGIGQEHGYLCSGSRSERDGFDEFLIDEGCLGDDLLFAEQEVVEDVEGRAVGEVLAGLVELGQVALQGLALLVVQFGVLLEVFLGFLHLGDVCGVGCGAALDALALGVELVVSGQEGVDVGAVREGFEGFEVGFDERLLGDGLFVASLLSVDDEGDEFPEACLVGDVHVDLACAVDSEVARVGHGCLVLFDVLVPGYLALVAI